MLKTVKPLMLETNKGEFINSNKIYTIQKNNKSVYFESSPNKCEYCVLTDEAYDLLTDSSKSSTKIDVKG